jgi:hypothetical protein
MNLARILPIFLLTLLALTTNAQAQSSRPSAGEVVMTEELMSRIIKFARKLEANSPVSATICKVFDLCDGSKDMPMKVAVSDTKVHFVGIPLNENAKDILIMVRHESGQYSAYLTDKSRKLRAAAVTENGVARLITNEKAAKDYKAVLALLAKESAETLTPSGDVK